MEAQLAAYRARKAKEKAEQEKGKGFLSALRSSSVDVKEERKQEELKTWEGRSERLGESSLGVSHRKEPSGLSRYLQRYEHLWTTPSMAKLALWLVLWGMFSYVEFGCVFFIASAFIFVLSNMRNGPKESGKLSAYSVFNPNCERLDGTFTTEQFEKELRYGAGSMGS